MIRVVYSNRTEALVTELAARVREQQARDGALVAVPVVVPSGAVEEYVRIGVARACGVAANLDTMLMTRFASLQATARGVARVASAEDIEAMCLTLLLDDALAAESDLHPVRAYLAAAPSPDAAAVRRVQLASRVGRWFEEYTYSRPELLSSWRSGATLDGANVECERWQRRLWLAMFGPEGLARDRGLTPLPEALATFVSPALQGAASNAVHVFAFPHFARVFHDLLARVAAERDVIVYSLSPCEGFWEDFDPRDPPALQLWGRPGREHVRALDALAGFDHDDRFVEPSAPGLLAQLQRDILHREPAREAVDPSFAFEDDETMVVLEHASVRREVEAVASEIWRLVGSDPTLRFDQISVLVPDAESTAYLSHVRAVFRAAHQLPFQTVGIDSADQTGITEAIHLLLSLPVGRFTRQDLLRLAVHPCVLAAMGRSDPARWIEWCDRLGVVHGADRADHEDTYIERDIFNWDQGLRRLALGALMAGDPSAEPRPFVLGEESYVPFEVASSELGEAAAFGLLVRSLVADACFLRDAQLSMAEWASLLVALVRTYVGARDEGDADEIVRCLRRLHGLSGVDLGGRRVPYRVALELARATLDSPPGRRGAEGVVVSHVAAVRSLPFRVVFACGMGEGRFPCSAPEDSLDLRWAKRCEGDVTARERDKYAFLETILGARDRLYLSYVSRDALTGDPIEPSPVVSDLVAVLGNGYVRRTSALRRRHPLRRWDPSYFPELFGAQAVGPTMALPEARAEAQSLALRRTLEAGGSLPDSGEIAERAASDPSWRAVADHLRLCAPVVPTSASESRVVVVPMYALVKFLEFPLQGWARYRVGMDELEDEDVLAQEDEPFETHPRDETLVLRAVLLDAAKGRSLEEAYDQWAGGRELRGAGPSGAFARAEREEHLLVLRTWSEQLAAFGVDVASVGVHRFGRAGEHASADFVHPAVGLDLELDDAIDRRTHWVRVEVGGRTLPASGAGGSLTLLRRAQDMPKEWAAADRQRAALRAFVDHAVLTAAGVADGPRDSLLVMAVAGGQPVTERLSFEPLTRAEATTWLRSLTRELLGGTHDYFLPCEAVFVSRGKGDVLASTLERARELLENGDGPPALRSAYGPVPHPSAYPALDDARAEEIVQRRFGLFFDKIRSHRS